MLPGVFEETRALHEEIERSEAAVVGLLREKVRTRRGEVRRDHAMAALLRHIEECGTKLAQLYGDGARRQQEMDGTNCADVRAMDTFYACVRAAEGKKPVEGEWMDIMAAVVYGSGILVDGRNYALKDLFSGAEHWGRFVDLAVLFAEFQNVCPQNAEMDYGSYLAKLEECAVSATIKHSVTPFSEVAKKLKGKISPTSLLLTAFSLVDVKREPPKPWTAECMDELGRWERFFENFKNYLVLFFRRAQPLFDIDGKVAAVEGMWSEVVAKDMVRSIEDERITQQILDEQNRVRLAAERKMKRMALEEKKMEKAGKLKSDDIDDDDDECVAEVPDGDALSAPVHCDLCGKDFAKPVLLEYHEKSKQHLSREKFWKGKLGEWTEKRTAILHMAFVCVALLAELKDVIRLTRDYVTRKQARNAREVDEEAEEAMYRAGEDYDSEEDEEKLLEEEEKLVARDENEQVKRGIKNYPVGWDGEPIPYWMYKLQGLGVEYKCEICGNTSFWGRKAFEIHFNDWRHTQALSVLGITNTVEFFEVTKIADAVALNKRLQAEKKQAEWDPEADEEYEDAEGRVYTRKLYEMMVKQGLIKPVK